jgi:hypothetical protein
MESGASENSRGTKVRFLSPGSEWKFLHAVIPVNESVLRSHGGRRPGPSPPVERRGAGGHRDKLGDGPQVPLFWGPIPHSSTLCTIVPQQ